MKIEAAPLSQSADDLAAFAEGLQELSEHARRALDEYQATHGKLEALLRSSSEAQDEFQHSHRADLATISSEIAESLGAVADLRRRTLAALRDIGALSRRVGEQIGQCVVALQIGDSTRQRVEHVHAALELARGPAEEETRPRARTKRARVFARARGSAGCRRFSSKARSTNSSREIGDGFGLARRPRRRDGRSRAAAAARCSAPAIWDGGSLLDVLERKLAAAQRDRRGMPSARVRSWTRRPPPSRRPWPTSAAHDAAARDRRRRHDHRDERAAEVDAARRTRQGVQRDRAGIAHLQRPDRRRHQGAAAGARPRRDMRGSDSARPGAASTPASSPSSTRA